MVALGQEVREARIIAYKEGLVFPTDELIRRLTALKSRRHEECDDPWYSCPKSDYGCANEYAGPDCTCGADARNAEIDALLAWVAAQP